MDSRRLVESMPLPLRLLTRAGRSILPAVLVGWLAFQSATDGLAQQFDLNIYHINVGQGDATLIVSPTGRTVLIDGGNIGKGNSAVVPLLRTLGISSLDYVIASHYDADHIGGLDEVVDSLGGINDAAFDRGDSDLAKRTDEYNDYVASVGAKRKTIQPGTELDLGPEVEMECVAVNGVVVSRSQRPTRRLDENGHSIALRLRYGKFDYFTGGDLTGGGKSGGRTTADVETIVADVVGNVDVLRVSHHGSSTSSNMLFLETLQPETAIISVGTGGVNLRYKHPTRDVLNRLHDVTSLDIVFQTSRGNTRGGLRQRDRELIEVADETVHLSTDGSRYVINGRAFAVDEE